VLASCGADHALLLHNVDDPEEAASNLDELLCQRSRSSSAGMKRSEVQASSDGRWLGVGHADGSMEVWALWAADPQLALVFHSKRGVVNRLEFRGGARARARRGACAH
jgi:hypothetical protein